MYELKRVETVEDWRQLHAIRRAVLFSPVRHKFEYDENHPDDRAEGNVPYLLLLDGAPIGVVRLDKRASLGVVRLVAIRSERQREGHGRIMSDLIDAEELRLGITELCVNAAADAVGYYDKTGWKRGSWDPTELTGLAENCVQMTKSLSSIP
jgi:N-acetylglutamate synthase-like GNAT family acetyltransferase